MKHLKRIKLDCSYTELQECVVEMFDSYVNVNIEAHYGVLNTLVDFFSETMDAFGMEKLCLLIISAVYEIQHNDVDPDIIYGVMNDIADFETGECDDLFTDEDLKLIRTDIEIIKEYAGNHPEMLVD